MSPASRTVRVAVLGTGAIAQVAHLPILARLKGVELAALCDVERSKARTLAERFSVPRVYRSTEELWQDETVEAVVICTPSHLHEQHAREALEAGKFVFCERPLALSAAEAERVLATPGAGSRLMVGMNQRFRGDAATLKPFITGGELGRVIYLRAGWLNRRAGQTRTWRQRRASAGGGALMDLGFQMLDLALWLLDYPAPERVSAHLHRRPGLEVEDSAVLLLGLHGGRAINLEVTWNLIGERERQYLHLLGEAGSASLSPLTVFKEIDGRLLNVTPAAAPGRESQFTATYRQELVHFLEMVRGLREGEPPAEQAVLLRILEAAYRAAETGREVVL